MGRASTSDSGSGCSIGPGSVKRGRRFGPQGWGGVALRVLLLLLFAVGAFAGVAALGDGGSDMSSSSSGDSDGDGSGWGGMTMEQFEALDGFFNGTRPTRLPGGTRDLEAMSEEELEAELKGLIQAMRPPREKQPFPKVDLTAFNQIHEQLAQVFDPTGEHARAMEASGRRRSSRSRRLSYVGIINKCVPNRSVYVYVLPTAASLMHHALD